MDSSESLPHYPPVSPLPVPQAFSVTLSRQMGSLGEEVGRLAAQGLNFRFVWRELINQAALQAGAPEAALSVMDELGLLSISPAPEDSLAYQNAVQEIMEELAAQGGVVIMGRAGQMILRGHPHVLHVRVCAPVEVRVERVAARQKIALKHARAQVTASDRSRRSYLRRFYHARWEDPELYDLVINTAQIEAQEAADLIAQAVSLRMQRQVQRGRIPRSASQPEVSGVKLE